MGFAVFPFPPTDGGIGNADLLLQLSLTQLQKRTDRFYLFCKLHIVNIQCYRFYKKILLRSIYHNIAFFE